MKIKKVAVIGLGYVGLPTLVAIHRTKLYSVVGFDVDQKKIANLKAGISPIEDTIVRDYLKKQRPDVSTDESILKESDVFIIAVPTPVYDDYLPNYEYVISAGVTAAKYLSKGGHIVLESTVNPGTCEEVLIPVLEKETGLKTGVDFNVTHCPERINPGDTKWTIYNINRNIGSINPKLNKQIANFYRSFITDAQVNEVSSLAVAESTKILENTFRDVNIALANELAKSFDVLGIDLVETITASSNKPFGFMPHWPGTGVGGHCIAVDPYFLIDRAARSGFDHEFLKLARNINNSMPEYTVRKLLLGLNKLGLPVKGTKVLLLGLSYKPNLGDLRESPALKIKEKIENLYADLTVYDPYFPDYAKHDLKKLLKTSQAIVIATAHSAFVKELPKLLPKSAVKLIVDGRNCLNPVKIRALGIKYKGIGR